MLYGTVAATASFLLAAFLAASLRGPALRLGLVDRRRRRPVPLLGGAAVVLATALVTWTGEWTGAVPLGAGAGRLLAAGVAVGTLGLAADAWRLRRRWRLAGTAVAAACVVPYGETGPWAGALAALWVALVAVAFQGLDRADGTAGAVGVVTAFGVGACAAAELRDGVAVLLLALAAALTGFLLHNWHPARIALGACGSLFAGFLLAGAAVTARAGHGVGSGAGVLGALTAVVCADAVLVLLSRRLAGRPPLRSAPDHLVHRLRHLGLTPPGTAAALAAAALATVLAGALVHTGRLGWPALLWPAGGVAAGVAVLLRVRVYGAGRAVAGPGGGRGRRRYGRTGSRYGGTGSRYGGISRRPPLALAPGGAGPRRATAIGIPAPQGVPAHASSVPVGGIFPVRQSGPGKEPQGGEPLRVRSG